MDSSDVTKIGHEPNISHSLGTLAARGLIVIRRTPGGKAEALALTAEGRKVASAIT